MPPTSSSPSSFFLSHLHFKEPESCAGTSPPYHLCTISTGTPSAQPRWMWCSLSFLLTSQLHCGKHRPCWVKRGCDPEFDLFRTVVATLSSSNTRGRSTRSILMETTDRREGVHIKWFLVHSAWASIRNKERASVSPLSFMNHQMLYFMNMDLVLFETAPKLKWCSFLWDGLLGMVAERLWNSIKNIDEWVTVTDVKKRPLLYTLLLLLLQDNKIQE